MRLYSVILKDGRVEDVTYTRFAPLGWRVLLDGKQLRLALREPRAGRSWRYVTSDRAKNVRGFASLDLLVEHALYKQGYWDSE
jgi:hypothetical protein